MDNFHKANMKHVDGMDDEKLCETLDNPSELKQSTLEAIRLAFFQDWVEQATKDEIIEKLIQNDERAKKEMRYDNQTAKIDMKLEMYRELATRVDANNDLFSTQEVINLLEYIKS